MLALGPGQIYNSNRVLLCAWLKRLQCEVRVRRWRTCTMSNLILSTGGVSVGEADFLGHALREDGELALWKLAIKPGKPLTCGHFRGVPVIGLPGNPASTLVTFALLARAYLLRRQGVLDVAPLQFPVPAGFVWTRPGNRREYLRGQGGDLPQSELWCGCAARRGPSGLIEVREGKTVAEGDWVNFIPLSEVLG